jgi:hypothetical protein
VWQELDLIAFGGERCREKLKGRIGVEEEEEEEEGEGGVHRRRGNLCAWNV